MTQPATNEDIFLTNGENVGGNLADHFLTCAKLGRYLTVASGSRFIITDDLREKNFMPDAAAMAAIYSRDGLVAEAALLPISQTIPIMDVGQRDAALIRFSNGKTMLVDAGNRNRWEDYGARIVLPVLHYFGIKQLNWTVMSHPHTDHIGGLVSVVEEIHTDTLWDSYAEYGSRTYNHLLDRYSNSGTEIIIPNRGDILEMAPLESIHILAPDSSFASQSHNINNASIVFKLTVGETSLLFTGDIEKEGDERLLNFAEYLKTDVLKVAYHSSITDTSNALLKVISPVMAVVSVGEGNKFSHP